MNIRTTLPAIFHPWNGLKRLGKTPAANFVTAPLAHDA